MKWVKFALLVLAWVVVILLGRYVNRGWYVVLLFAAFPSWGLLAWIFSTEYTAEELARQAAQDAARRVEWQGQLELSPEYRVEQIRAALYERAKAGDVEAMKAYLDHQQWRAKQPQRRIGAYGEADMPWG